MATDDYMMLAKKSFPIRFSDDGGSTVEVEMVAKARVYDEVNRLEVRGRNYEGYLLVVLDPDGEILELKTNLNWLDDDKLEAFRRFKVFNFFNEDCKKVSTPRPRYYNDRKGAP